MEMLKQTSQGHSCAVTEPDFEARVSSWEFLSRISVFSFSLEQLFPPHTSPFPFFTDCLPVRTYWGR